MTWDNQFDPRNGPIVDPAMNGIFRMVTILSDVSSTETPENSPSQTINSLIGTMPMPHPIPIRAMEETAWMTAGICFVVCINAARDKGPTQAVGGASI